MKARLIEKAFYTTGTLLSLSEVKAKALLFLDYIKLTSEDLSDYWYGIAENWDLNIWMPDDKTNEIAMSLYRVENGETEYEYPIRIYPLTDNSLVI